MPYLTPSSLVGLNFLSNQIHHFCQTPMSEAQARQLVRNHVQNASTEKRTEVLGFC